MAGGVLAMVSLYSLGFRESRQSEQDVAAAGYADAFFAPLVSELSSMSMKWSEWCDVCEDPDNEAEKFCDGIAPKNGTRVGWGAYAESVGNQKSEYFRVVSDPNRLADDVVDRIIGKANDGVSRTKPKFSKSDIYYGLVATRRGGSIGLAFRCSKRKELLLSQPVYYTEVHFQGKTDQ